VTHDAVDTTQTLTGIYASRTLGAGNAFETYLLDSVRGKAVLGRGAAAENRWTAGLRAVRPAGRLTAEAEAAYQFGTFASRPANATIAAVSVAGSLAYRFGGSAIKVLEEIVARNLLEALLAVYKEQPVVLALDAGGPAAGPGLRSSTSFIPCSSSALSLSARRPVSCSSYHADSRSASACAIPWL